MTGDEFRSLLTDRGWQQLQFADLVGKSARQVNRWLQMDLVPKWVEIVARSLPQRRVGVVTEHRQVDSYAVQAVSVISAGNE